MSLVSMKALLTRKLPSTKAVAIVWLVLTSVLPLPKEPQTVRKYMIDKRLTVKTFAAMTTCELEPMSPLLEVSTRRLPLVKGSSKTVRPARMKSPVCTSGSLMIGINMSVLRPASMILLQMIRMNRLLAMKRFLMTKILQLKRMRAYRTGNESGAMKEPVTMVRSL